MQGPSPSFYETGQYPLLGTLPHAKLHPVTRSQRLCLRVIMAIPSKLFERSNNYYRAPAVIDSP